MYVWAIIFEAIDTETSIFDMVVHLDHVRDMFKCQGHWLNIKVKNWKMLISRSQTRSNSSQGHCRVDFFWLSTGKWEVGLLLKGILVYAWILISTAPPGERWTDASVLFVVTVCGDQSPFFVEPLVLSISDFDSVSA